MTPLMNSILSLMLCLSNFKIPYGSRLFVEEFVILKLKEALILRRAGGLAQAKKPITPDIDDMTGDLFRVLITKK